jgi:hypothetical protein
MTKMLRTAPGLHPNHKDPEVFATRSGKNHAGKEWLKADFEYVVTFSP